MASDKVQAMAWPVLVHSVRTALVAVISLLVARLFRLPASYWAPITTLVITQSSLGAAFAVSSQRFIGTLLGALVGGVAAAWFGSNVLVFGVCLFLLGLLCAVTQAGLAAYRFGSIAVAIVILVPRSSSAWVVAFNRFAEVSIGIGVALLLAVVWPEREAIPSSQASK